MVMYEPNLEYILNILIDLFIQQVSVKCSLCIRYSVRNQKYRNE